MGGSSLGPEVLAKTFGHKGGWPRLRVLDSTVPAQIEALEADLDLGKTLFIVSSKSGSTTEPNVLTDYFFERVADTVGADKAGSHFIAITDPGSSLQQRAEAGTFATVFYGVPSIGGRYSVLSPFGLVPAADCRHRRCRADPLDADDDALLRPGRAAVGKSRRRAGDCAGRRRLAWPRQGHDFRFARRYPISAPGLSNCLRNRPANTARA